LIPKNAGTSPEAAAVSDSIYREMFAMTMDKSLRIRAGSNKVRSVMTRVERIMKLKEDEKFAEGISRPYGLPKVRVPNLSLKKKKKKKEEGDEAAAPAKGAAAKPAAGAKGAAAKPAAAAAKPAAKK
jgi:small basic protein (TIGR04137 family)